MTRALIKLFNPLPARAAVTKAYNKETNRQIKILRRAARTNLLADGTAILFVRGYHDEAISDVVAELRDLGWDVQLVDNYYLEIK